MPPHNLIQSESFGSSGLNLDFWLTPMSNLHY